MFLTRDFLDEGFKPFAPIVGTVETLLIHSLRF